MSEAFVLTAELFELFARGYDEEVEDVLAGGGRKPKVCDDPSTVLELDRVADLFEVAADRDFLLDGSVRVVEVVDLARSGHRDICTPWIGGTYRCSVGLFVFRGFCLAVLEVRNGSLLKCLLVVCGFGEAVVKAAIEDFLELKRQRAGVERFARVGPRGRSGPARTICSKLNALEARSTVDVNTGNIGSASRLLERAR